MLNEAQAKQLVEKATTDAKFRALAKKDPKKALESLGAKVPAGLKIQVHENTPSSIHAVLPEKAGKLAGSGVDPNVAKVFEKAWADPKFKAKLLKNPAEAIKEATGAQIPKKISLSIHENGKDTVHFVLPYVPAKSGELSDDDLEMVAGGKGGGNPSAGGCGNALAVQGSIVTAGAAAAGTGVPGISQVGAVAAVGCIFGSFITMAVSASK
jgi:hypothetical protein